MSWKEDYRKKLTTPEKAVARVRSGDRVVTGHASGEPPKIIEALVAAAESYENVEIVHMVPMGTAAYCGEEYRGHFRHNSLFAGAATRNAIAGGRADFTVTHFSRVPSLFSEKILPVDVTLCMVSPPDAHGFCSFGVSVDYTMPAARHSRIVIAEVTPHMPRTLGNSFIHVSDIDCIVETDSRPAPLKPPQTGPLDEKIGNHCASLIRDGDCLQLGIGAVPDSVLSFLVGKNDLGIHTEMFSDGVVDLVERGVVTCKNKNFHPGRMIATFLIGTEKLYSFVDNNPLVEMQSVDYTNNPAVIARNDNMVSINSAIQVDLTGQACSDTIGHRQFSGTGGQADFVRGAAWSRGGRSILAFHSTASKGTVSRIVPFLDKGASVTTTRTDIHYVVTEHGIADLRGKSVRERGESLIGIANPDFRENLREEFRKAYRSTIQ